MESVTLLGDEDLILTVVRHGETDWNLQERMMGQMDVPLNANGVVQAQRVGKRLADEPVDVIVTSDLSRALETARAIAAHHPQVPVAPDARFRERLLGAFQGLTRKETAEHFPEVIGQVDRDGEHTPIPGGETRAAMRDRIRDGLKCLMEKHEGRRVMLVTHGGVLQRLVEILNEWGCVIDPHTVFPNTCVLTVDLSAVPPQVLVECDASHLGDMAYADDGQLRV